MDDNSLFSIVAVFTIILLLCFCQYCYNKKSEQFSDEDLVKPYKCPCKDKPGCDGKETEGFCSKCSVNIQGSNEEYCACKEGFCACAK